MGLLRINLRSKGKNRLDRAAQRLANICQREVAQRLRGLREDMSVSEMRGYIRARAAVVVHREVNQAIRQDRRLRTTDRSKLLSLVNDLLENQVVSNSRRDESRVAA